MLREFAVLLTIWMLVVACDDCSSYELDQATLIEKGENGLFVSWKGESESVRCSSQELYNLLEVGSNVWIVKSSNSTSALPVRVATANDIRDIPCNEHENWGPRWRRLPDGKGKVVLTDEDLANYAFLDPNFKSKSLDPEAPEVEEESNSEEVNWMDEIWKEE